MRCTFFLLIAGAVWISCAQAPKPEISDGLFALHFISRDMPGDEQWGYGTPALADFDRDGDLDYAFCARQDSVYWFEFQGPDSWVRHGLGAIDQVQLGSAVLDVDGDGWIDLVIGGRWYRNPATPRTDPFTAYVYDPDIDSEIHDIVTADMDGDGIEDVIVLGDREGVYWYRVAKKPLEGLPWTRIGVTQIVRDEYDDIHGGIFPGGVADLDGDGDADLVLPDRWYENSARGVEWIEHALPFGKRGPWGLSARSIIYDLNRDGDADIVMVDTDQTGSRAAWLENDGASPPAFTAHFLPHTATGTRGSFHSLVLADFDGDGDQDIFTVEQEDPSILPQGAGPRWYIWENLDGRGGAFAERVILDARLGGHDARVGDVDNDGDLDICAKIWKRWPDNANRGVEHAIFLENIL